MRRSVFILTASLFISQCLFSQDNKVVQDQSIGKSSFFAELGGPGILFSANYDTRFKQSRLGFGGRVGIGFVSAYDEYYDPNTGMYYGGDEETAITFPVQLNYIFGKQNSPHTFEVGGGLTYVTKKLNIMDFDAWDNEDQRTQLFGTFCFMYRRQPINGGFSWRIGFTPLVCAGNINHFGGASVWYKY